MSGETVLYKNLIGVDIGGSKIAVGIVDPNGKPISKTAFPTPRENGPHEALKLTIEALKSILNDAGAAGIAGMGIGCASPLDSVNGLILSPPNLPGWDRFPIRQILQDAFGFETYLDNDANAAALGEFHYGSGRGSRSMVYLTVSTGIGGGIVLDGRIYRGSRSNAGEVGHQVMDPEGPLCGCGQKGCLETLASGTAIGRNGREAAKADPSTLMVELAGNVGNIDARTVAEAASLGDAAARRVLEEAAVWLGRGLANIVNVLDPERLVIGGGVSASLDLMIETVRAEMAVRVLSPDSKNTPILKAALGESVGVVGAAALALECTMSGLSTQ